MKILSENMITRIGLLLFLLASINSLGQGTKTINLLRADKMTYNREENEHVRKCVGNVAFEVDSIFMYCDSAYLNDKEKNLDAYGHVHIKVNDSLNLYSDILHYNGNTRIADMISNVKLVDSTTTLTTNRLKYNRNTEIASYRSGGTIVDTVNRLTSVEGYYHTSINEFVFRRKVRVYNPDYTIRSDTMKYQTDTKITYFYGPSTIVSEENTIFCHYGWYDTQNDISEFKYQASIDNGEQTIKGDSLFYDRNTGTGVAVRNVWIRDTVNDVILTGNYSRYNEFQHQAFITDSATAILISQSDSLFLSADTVRALLDSTNQLEKVQAFYGARFYHVNLQGIADSITYSMKDSLITLFDDPVLWSDDNQISADTIRIKVNENEVENMQLYKSGIIIARDTLDEYNQIQAKYMKAYFKNNDLEKIYAEGNSETLYYVKDADSSLIGINKIASSSVNIFFENNRFRWITHIGKPEGHLFPQKDIAPADRRLKNFIWRQHERPQSRDDIY
jgi:lipopolysaccharide export system protein LptA